MFTNELKKGDKVRLHNGWDAKIEDNMKGIRRLCTVYGYETEMGSVYSHDIMYKYEADGTQTKIDYTPAQLKCKTAANSFGF